MRSVGAGWGFRNRITLNQNFEFTEPRIIAASNISNARSNRKMHPLTEQIHIDAYNSEPLCFHGLFPCPFLIPCRLVMNLASISRRSQGNCGSSIATTT